MKKILKIFLPFTPILYLMWVSSLSNGNNIFGDSLYIILSIVMVYLAYKLFMHDKIVHDVKSISDLSEKHNIENEHELSRIKKQATELNAKKIELEKFELFLNSLEAERKIGIPYAANIIADYRCELDRHIENALKYKTRPSLKGAEAVKILSKEKRELIVENISLKAKILEYEWTIPEISDLVDLSYSINDNQNSIAVDENEDWISDEIYSGLTLEEKCQKALDKYASRNMKKWEIGREYERYIGYLYEIDGWDVSYFGIVKGVEDLGRDIISKKMI